MVRFITIKGRTYNFRIVDSAPDGQLTYIYGDGEKPQVWPSPDWRDSGIDNTIRAFRDAMKSNYQPSSHWIESEVNTDSFFKIVYALGLVEEQSAYNTGYVPGFPRYTEPPVIPIQLTSLECEDCKYSRTDVELTYCPFEEEIHGNKVTVALCKNCYEARCDEI